MEPWTRVMSKLTEHTTYRIEDKGYDWWKVLGAHTIYEQTAYEGEKPLTVALIARVHPGHRRYKLQAGGKDSRVWEQITANVPAEMVGYGIKGNRFEWGRLSLAWIYYRNGEAPTSKYIRIIGEL